MDWNMLMTPLEWNLLAMSLSELLVRKLEAVTCSRKSSGIRQMPAPGVNRVSESMPANYRLLMRSADFVIYLPDI